MPRLLTLLCIGVLGLGLGGCREFGDVTASIAGSSSAAPPADDSGLRDYTDHWGKVYADKPAIEK